MKHARVLYQGQIHAATPVEHTETSPLKLANGEVVEQEAVQWFIPLEPCVGRARTILCLGLNYSDHARELAFKPPTEPLAFLKGQSSLAGHRSLTPRPTGVKMMHYECELAVVIGKTARSVKAGDAYDFISGYCVANDFAVRDYLENWYRPNLKVKGRPGCTLLGPWFVDAADIADPMNLTLQTIVDGKVTQTGNTCDMIFNIPTLIEYFSSFMTLLPGDLILTGTPDGVVDCPVGASIVTEIDAVGALQTTMIHEY